MWYWWKYYIWRRILNGQRNGKGKEYSSDGKLIFEGEYINGLRNGKGKEYDKGNGILIFEGEYSYRQRNGKGKEYDYDDKLIFEGEYLNDNKWTGKLYYIEIFNGKYIIDEMNEYKTEHDEQGFII